MTLKRLQKLADDQNFRVSYSPKSGCQYAILNIMRMGNTFYGSKKRMIKKATKWLEKLDAKS